MGRNSRRSVSEGRVRGCSHSSKRRPRSGPHCDTVRYRGRTTPRFRETLRGGPSCRCRSLPLSSWVLSADISATKGIITTTSEFAPGVYTDPFIAPTIPYRLELMDGNRLQQWLRELSLG